MAYDLVLLHAPSIYDFREFPIMHGPISDVIPSTPIFEMYPVGFVSISEYLTRRGLEVRIINVAQKMLHKRSYSFEDEIKKIRAVAFGIDLHWMPHVHGSIELARIVKKYHPESYVIFGGYSTSYYHRELIENYPEIDFAVRGDSTERVVYRLIKALKEGKDVDGIPNITYRKGDEVVENPLSEVPDTMDHISIDYSHLMRKVVKYRDPKGYEPFKEWFKYPMTAVFTCRGCIYNCRTCGASSWAIRRICGRKRPAFRSPELLAKDIENVSKFLRAPIFIIGDLMQPGYEYFEKLMFHLRKLDIDNEFVVEFFRPPEPDVLKVIKSSLKNYNIEISPESHDDEVRKAFGRPYTTRELESFMEEARKWGCKRLDIFFMIGLPKQDFESVMGTVSYARDAMKEYGTFLYPFISPLAPFLDPGSYAFENPDECGYRILFRDVESHRKALRSPSWKYFLNYETHWMTRDDIVRSTYEAALKLNEAKMKFGHVPKKRGKEIESNIKNAYGVFEMIEGMISGNNHRDMGFLSGKVEEFNMNTICAKEEWKWPIRFMRMNIISIAKNILFPIKPPVRELPQDQVDT